MDREAELRERVAQLETENSTLRGQVEAYPSAVSDDEARVVVRAGGVDGARRRAHRARLPDGAAGRGQRVGEVNSHRH